MKSLSSTAVAALTAAVISLAGLVPQAVAQQQAPQAAPGGMQQMQPPGVHPHGFGNHHHMGPRMHQQGGRMQGNRMQRGGRGLLNLVCSERGAERMEIAFVRLSHRIELTAEQQPLFDDLRQSALTTQTSFADDCAEARPGATAVAPATPLDPVTGLRTMIDLEKARIAGLEALLPKFEAFFNSLTEEQKNQLMPRQRGGRLGQGQMPVPGPGSQPDAQPTPPAGTNT